MRAADAEAYRTRANAEADRDQAKLNAEAEAFRKRALAEADRDQAKLAAEADAFISTTLAEADAQAARVRADAAAHAERSTADGQADANTALADSLREGNQELIAASRIIEELPELVGAASLGIAGSSLTVLNGAARGHVGEAQPDPPRTARWPLPGPRCPPRCRSGAHDHLRQFGRRSRLLHHVMTVVGINV